MAVAFLAQPATAAQGRQPALVLDRGRLRDDDPVEDQDDPRHDEEQEADRDSQSRHDRGRGDDGQHPEAAQRHRGKLGCRPRRTSPTAWTCRAETSGPITTQSISPSKVTPLMPTDSRVKTPEPVTVRTINSYGTITPAARTKKSHG